MPTASPGRGEPATVTSNAWSMAVVSTGPASTTCAETIAGSAASRTKAIIGKYARAYFMQAVRRSRRGHPAPARRRKKGRPDMGRSEEHTSELQSLMRKPYAVFGLKKKTKIKQEE